MDRLSSMNEIREHMGMGADYLNMVVFTSMTAFNDEGEEQIYLDQATSLQAEGFILHPRHLESAAFEVSTKDPIEAEYLLALVRDSAGYLAMKQSEALLLARTQLSRPLGAYLKDNETED